ncbi:MAG: nucleotide exchange factor GrpE [Phycisphaerae bacterium]|nr:nucleotide exchange factor GrpE [Phycisphaerae bacterium]
MKKRKEKASKSAAVEERKPDEAVATEDQPRAEAEDELTKLRREVEELREKNLRIIAESQNLQKRAQREQQEAVRFAEAEFVRELLVVLDDFERTQESAKSAADVQSVADGVRIVYEHFLKVLNQHGIKPIEAVGRPFDPTYHAAMMQQPSDEHPAGTVMQEMARGYTMHERVLRPSRVIVSGDPAREQSEAEKKQDVTDEVK